jgi:hypothetical protein
MPSGPDVLSGLVSLVLYTVVMVSVYKVFQIAGDMNEIKELLKDIRRNTDTQALPEPAASVPNSMPSLVRAVNSASYSEVPSEVGQAAATRSEPQR